MISKKDIEKVKEPVKKLLKRKKIASLDEIEQFIRKKTNKRTDLFDVGEVLKSIGAKIIIEWGIKWNAKKEKKI